VARLDQEHELVPVLARVITDLKRFDFGVRVCGTQRPYQKALTNPGL